MELTGPGRGSSLAADGRRSDRAHACSARSTTAPTGRRRGATYLTCEENFNGYFGTREPVHADAADERLRRRRGGTNPWWLADPRFDLAVNPNEPNRFGWVVEIDPIDPGSTPKKRTALGRLKHENAAFAEADDGRAVIYTGDDERFQYLYKYVSARPWRSRRAAQPARRGHAVRRPFDADGSGTWLPAGRRSGARLRPLAEILIDTRGAAAAVGATPMDRPEWVAVHPLQPGVAYGTFTNNTNRTTTDAANPRPTNAFGHILRWQNTGGDHGAETFVWSVFVLAGAGSAPVTARPSPRRRLRLARRTRLRPRRTPVDRDRRHASQSPCNNQMLAADPVTGDIRRFLVGPEGMRDHRLDDDRRSANDVRQHPTPRRGRHRSGQPGVAVELARPPGAPAVGDGRDPPRRRRHDRHLTPSLRTSRRSATASPRRGGARLASVGGHRSSG